MIEGHGDDLYAYEGKIKHNFSSNILSGVDHSELMKAVASAGGCFDNYPEPRPVSLEQKLGEHIGVGAGNVMVTNGATEAIYLTAHAFAGADTAIVTPTFSEYEDACRMYGHKMGFISDVEDIPDDVSMVWLCNPNNPTGQAIAKDTLLSIVKGSREVTFVIDQAYADYTELPVLSAEEAVEAGNVVLLGSFTKRYSVPGLRVGYMIASEELIECLSRFRMPWSVSGCAIIGAEYLIDHSADYTINARALHSETVRLAGEFEQMGIAVSPTDCNFILCRLPHGTAADLKEYLAENHGILIRDASNFRGLSENHFRVAAQTPEENDLLISAVGRWLSLNNLKNSSKQL